MVRMWKYECQQRVRINEKAKKDLPSDVGKYGVIIERRSGITFDYGVLLDTGGEVRVKEEELELVDDKWEDD